MCNEPRALHARPFPRNWNSKKLYEDFYIGVVLYYVIIGYYLLDNIDISRMDLDLSAEGSLSSTVVVNLDLYFRLIRSIIKCHCMAGEEELLCEEQSGSLEVIYAAMSFSYLRVICVFYYLEMLLYLVLRTCNSTASWGRWRRFSWTRSSPHQAPRAGARRASSTSVTITAVSYYAFRFIIIFLRSHQKKYAVQIYLISTARKTNLSTRHSSIDTSRKLVSRLSCKLN